MNRLTRESACPRCRPLLLALASAALLAACGGGGGGAADPGPATPQSCDAGPRKEALRAYFNEWYFWYRSSPSPAPSDAVSLDAYFNSLLYTGGDPTFPADRWSYFDTTVNFNRFFGDGKALGYGVFVAGQEVTGRPDLPLYVRYIEPKSPAATAGVKRGDRIIAINGKPVAIVIANNDYAALTPANEGETLTLQLSDRTVSVTAAIYELVPVTQASIVSSPSGRKAGYFVVKDMINQALTPVSDAMASFRAAGVTELVVDLRYNGGGLVTLGRDLASLVAGSRGTGRPYASLLYNDKRAASNNTTYSFTNPANGLGLSRVYILVGERTCSASEQLAIGLKPIVDTVLVGRNTCGKPVGFLPHDDSCGNTYNVVNFESVNASSEGRYFDGLKPTCAASEDWSKPLGSPTEPFLATALKHADGGGCTAPAAVSTQQRALSARERVLVNDGERPASMIQR